MYKILSGGCSQTPEDSFSCVDAQLVHANSEGAGVCVPVPSMLADAIPKSRALAHLLFVRSTTVKSCANPEGRVAGGPDQPAKSQKYEG